MSEFKKWCYNCRSSEDVVKSYTGIGGSATEFWYCRKCKKEVTADLEKDIALAGTLWPKGDPIDLWNLYPGKDYD